MGPSAQGDGSVGPGRRKKLRGLGIGCGVLVGALLLFSASNILVLFTDYDRAVEVRRVIEDQFETQATFTPHDSGSIPEERMRRFIAVRRALKPLCENAAEHQRVFQRLHDYGELETPPVKDIFLDGALAVRSAALMGGDFGTYILKRNESLEANEMGLGEYTWTYIVTYYSWLGGRPASLIASDQRTGVFEERVYAEVADMVRRHVEGRLAAEGGESAADSPALSMWREEQRKLEEGHARIPFAGGLTDELRRSLEPFRAEVEALACPEASELEVVRTVERGLWYDHR